MNTEPQGRLPGSAKVGGACVPPEAADVLFLSKVSRLVRDRASWSAGVSGFSRLFC